MADHVADQPAAVGAPAEHSLLVGRDREFARLRGALSNTLDGRGGCLVVEGPAGIGKSRLLIDVQDLARDRGMAVAAGRASEAHRLIPLIGLLSALRSAGEAVIDAAVAEELRRTEGPRFWEIERLGELLERAARAQPVLVVLDDAHWADEGTALALRMLVPALESSAVLWLAGRRLLPERSPGQDTLNWLVGQGARGVSLEPLGADAVADLARHLLGAQPGPELMALANGGGGNPFLVQELLVSLVAGGQIRIDDGMATVVGQPPDAFGDTVRRRLLDLSPPTRRLLEAGSVLGRPFTVHEAGGLLGHSAVHVLAAAEEAVLAGALRPVGQRFEFRHDLIREACYAGLSGPTKSAMHRQAAAVLASEGASVAERADHVAQGAGKGDRDAIALLQNAIAELVGAAPRAAADLMMRVLELMPDGDPELPGIIAQAIRLTTFAGRIADACALGETVLQTRLDAAAEAAIRWGLAETLKLTGDDAGVIAHTDRVLSLAGVPPTIRASALAIRSFALPQVNRLDEAGDAAAEAVEIGTTAGAPYAAIHGRSARSHAAALRGELSDALTFAEQAVRVGDEVEGLARHLHPRFWLGRALGLVDRFDEADAAFDRTQRDAVEFGATWCLPLSHHGRSLLRHAAGQLDDASAEAEAGLRVSEQLNAMVMCAPLLIMLARIALRRGDLAAAREHLNGSQRMLDEGHQWPLEDLAWANALHYDATGDPVAALACLKDVFEAPQRLHALCVVDPGVAAQLVRVSQRAGAFAEAEAAVAVVAAHAERNPTVGSVAGAAAHARGLLDDDRTQLRDAVVAYRASPRPLDTASALEDAARGEDAVGNRGVAVELADEALDHYVRAGATRDAARVRRTLRRMGVRRRQPPAEGPDSAPVWGALTPSELRVVRLVADGLTNRETAERLYISRHTVDSHLRHAFAKLGVASRVEMVRQVMSHLIAEGPQ